MKYIKPTYEEYCKASKFAKLRYKYGVYIQLASMFLFLFLIYYTITNIEEMKSHPIDYAEEKFSVTCIPLINEINNKDGSFGDITGVRGGG